MLLLAGIQPRYFGISAAIAAPVLYYKLFHVAFRRARMLAFVNPEADPRGSGFHILQSLIAVGTGGFLGRGLTEGMGIPVLFLVSALVNTAWKGLTPPRRMQDAASESKPQKN